MNGMYDELDNKIIEALTSDSKLQWSYRQRKAVKVLILQRQIDAFSFMLTDMTAYKSLKTHPDVTILAQIDKLRDEIVAIEYN